MDWPIEAVPKVVTCGYFSHAPDTYRVVYNCPTHSIHLYTYHATVRIGDRCHAVEPGSVTVTPAGVDSSYSLSEEGRHWCIHFEPAEQIAGLTVTLPEFLPRVGRTQHESFRQIQALANRAGSRNAASRRRVSLLLQELLLAISEGETGSGAEVGSTRLDSVLSELTTHIEANLSRPLPVPDLARKVCMSQNYLSKRFRERFGQSIASYILSRRIEMAKYYLEATALTVGEIAIRVGIPNPQYFNKQFRRILGRSPTEYRGSRSGRGKS
jgi:AraC family transcriptional regulator